jgi:hypothetical protein
MRWSRPLLITYIVYFSLHNLHSQHTIVIESTLRIEQPVHRFTLYAIGTPLIPVGKWHCLHCPTLNPSSDGRDIDPQYASDLRDGQEFM